MDGSEVTGVEAPRDRLKAQLLGTLTPRFVLEGAQRLGVGKARFVFEDVRVRAKSRRPTRPSKGLTRVLCGVYAR